MEKRKPLSHPLSQSEGFGHIENYFRSGLRPQEYYHQNGISEWQFYNWRKRYLVAHPEAKPSSSMVKKKFYPVGIESSTGIRLSGLEIHYPHGVRVIISNEDPVAIENISALIKLRV